MSRAEYKLRFEDGCFDERKVRALSKKLPETYAALDEMAEWRKGDWPSRVRCMSHSEIAEGRSRGAGHGFTYTRGRGSQTIWMNPYMSTEGYWLVFVHECLHHAWPDASEREINCVHLPQIYERVWGKRLDPDWARKHGIGAPAPMVGDRSYCR